MCSVHTVKLALDWAKQARTLDDLAKVEAFAESSGVFRHGLGHVVRRALDERLEHIATEAA